MEVEGAGEEGSVGGGDGGSELSGLSPPDDEEAGGEDEPAEELPASSGELSSRTTTDGDCFRGGPGKEGKSFAMTEL